MGSAGFPFFKPLPESSSFGFRISGLPKSILDGRGKTCHDDGSRGKTCHDDGSRGKTCPFFSLPKEKERFVENLSKTHNTLSSALQNPHK
jgi:hypothetical protein